MSVFDGIGGFLGQVIDFLGLSMLDFPGRTVKPRPVVRIIFESHATTMDNEMELASGWNDAGLSELGTQQAAELGMRRKQENFDVIFTSDLQRASRTAEIAFTHRFPIVHDRRLREVDYGELTRHPAREVQGERTNRISVPFPGGESYEQASRRMREFLVDLLRDYAGKRVLIIGHRATQYGLEHWINGVPLLEAVTSPWSWQPGWNYELDQL